MTGEDSKLYGTYLGGDEDDIGYSVATDLNENVYLTGQTNSKNNFPITDSALQTTYQGGFNDAFLVKFNFRQEDLAADLLLEKYSCLCKVYPNKKIPYTIKIINKGPGIATNVVITDIVANGLNIEFTQASTGTISEEAGSVVWTIDELGVGQIEVANIILSADDILCNTSVINTVSLTSDTEILNPITTTDKSIIYVDCPTLDDECDLVLDKSTCCNNININSSCQCSQNITTVIPYTISIVNKGPSTANNIVVTDYLPSVMKFSSADASTGSISNLNNLVTWIIPKLEVGEKAEAVIVAIIYGLIDDQYIKNTAVAISSTPIKNESSCISTSIIYINSKKNRCGWFK